MENKYYTPDKTEFHEGFEYEWSFDNKGWNPDTFSIGSGDIDDMAGEYYEFSPNCPRTICRVKYLDKEDIESLGFDNYVPPMEYNHTWHYKNSRDPKISVWFNNEIPVVRIYDSYPSVCFHGSIKNKSELKKLMYQLGIL